MGTKRSTNKIDIRHRAVTVVKIFSHLLLLPTLIVMHYIITGQYIGCVFRKTTGIYCAGCGATRMVLAILHLRFYQAFRFNPFMFVTLPIVIICSAVWIIRYVLYGYICKHLDKLLIAYAISVIIYGIIRNISVFRWLMPTYI